MVYYISLHRLWSVIPYVPFEDFLITNLPRPLSTKQARDRARAKGGRSKRRWTDSCEYEKTVISIITIDQRASHRVDDDQFREDLPEEMKSMERDQRICGRILTA